MSDDEWSTTTNSYQAPPASSGGFNCGKGRGFTPAVSIDDDDCGSSNDFRGGRQGGRNGDFKRYDDGDGGRGRGRGSRGGRGRGGGRGGFNQDEDDGGSGGRRNFNRSDDDGGFGGRRNFNHDDDNGGFGGRKNFNRDDDNGGFGGRKNFNRDDDNGGFGGRKNFNRDDDNGGFGGRKNFNRDDDNGGFGGRKNFSRDGDNDNPGFGHNSDNDNRGFGRNGDYERGDGNSSRRGRGGRGNFGGDRDNTNENGENEEEKKPKAQTYVPPDPFENEDDHKFGISTGINFNKYESIQVNATGENVPHFISTYEEANLRKLILDNIKKIGYSKPTPVQKYSIPIIKAGRDLMACAQTGSGKTAAFLLPIIHYLLEEDVPCVYDAHHVEPQAIVLAPTRELASQIYESACIFVKGSSIKPQVAYGGTQVSSQKQRISRGCHIMVATTGRLNDYVERGFVNFNSCKFFVLDEADRMLDMGFLPCIEKCLSHPSMAEHADDRQTLMFSATFPQPIQRLAGKFLKNYIFLTVGIVGGACSDVEQRFFEVSKFEKKDKLKELIIQEDLNRTLVFVETQRLADLISIFLSENKFPTTSIHGAREQREREEALSDFKRGRMKILVATGVASRGLDIEGVEHVINFDLPKEIDEYVHRIGRTGRLGNRGKATSFYDPKFDSNLAASLVTILKQAGQTVPDFLESASEGGMGPSYSGHSGFGGRDFRQRESGEPFADNANNGPAPQEDDENL